MITYRYAVFSCASTILALPQHKSIVIEHCITLTRWHLERASKTSATGVFNQTNHRLGGAVGHSGLSLRLTHEYRIRNVGFQTYLSHNWSSVIVLRVLSVCETSSVIRIISFSHAFFFFDVLAVIVRDGIKIGIHG